MLHPDCLKGAHKCSSRQRLCFNYLNNNAELGQAWLV